MDREELNTVIKSYRDYYERLHEAEGYFTIGGQLFLDDEYRLLIEGEYIYNNYINRHELDISSFLIRDLIRY